MAITTGLHDKYVADGAYNTERKEAFFAANPDAAVGRHFTDLFTGAEWEIMSFTYIEGSVQTNCAWVNDESGAVTDYMRLYQSLGTDYVTFIPLP